MEEEEEEEDDRIVKKEGKLGFGLVAVEGKKKKKLGFLWRTRVVGVIEIIFGKRFVCVFCVFFVLYVSRSKFVWLPLFLLSNRSHSLRGRQLENDTC